METAFYLWIAFIVLEAIRNWYMIEIKKMEINHTRQFIIRSIIGLAFWIISPIAAHDFSWTGWWLMPLMMGSTFWSGFDMLLNIFRKKSIFYFGKKPFLDKIQSEWPQPWVYFKLFFAGASITAYFHL